MCTAPGASQALHNVGKAFGLLQGCSIRMVSRFIAMERSLWQKSTLSSVFHGPKYAALLDIVKTEEKIWLATIDVKPCQYWKWKAKYKLLCVIKSALIALRCADSNEASTVKIYFFTDRISKNLVKFADDLNNEELFPPLEDGDAGMDCVELEEDMVFGKTSDGREGDIMTALIPGDEEELGDDVGLAPKQAPH